MINLSYYKRFTVNNDPNYLKGLVQAIYDEHFVPSGFCYYTDVVKGIIYAVTHDDIEQGNFPWLHRDDSGVFPVSVVVGRSDLSYYAERSEDDIKRIIFNLVPSKLLLGGRKYDNNY